MTYRSFSSSPSSRTVAKPAGVIEGDVMIALGHGFNATAAAPSGWTLIASETGYTVKRFVYMKVATASEPSSYTFMGTGGSSWSTAIVAHYDVTYDKTAAQTTTNTSSGTLPSMTVTKSGSTLVGVASESAGGRTFAPPSGYVERVDAPDIYGYTFADRGSVAAGGRPAGQFTLSGTSYEVFVALVSLSPTNSAPNAPILTAPADSAVIDRNSVQRFDWDFSDPDAGDTQSKYDLHYRAVGAGTWTDVTGTTPNTYHDFVGGTFAAGDYEWQVRTYDAQGVVGPYSASSFFTAANAPEEPTITDPVNGATVSSSHTAVWSTPDQDAYQIRRVADNAGSPDGTTVYYDSGEQVTTTARSHQLTFETNNRYEHIQVRQKRDGLWSQWASIRVQVAYTPPPTPVVSLLADTDAGALVVTVTNPAPGAGEPAVNYNDIYVDDGDGEFRAATLVVPNSSWTYWLPRAQHDYTGNIRVVAVADNGVTASS